MRHTLVFFITFWVGAASTGKLARASEAEQISPDIALDPAIECWFHSQFPTLGAEVSPFEDIVRARLYFRCSLYPDYYFVDLSVLNGQFEAVAPQAEESCPAVHYYVEALSSDFTSSRTEERIADVTSESECRRRYPAAAWFPGDEPGIVLGSTVAGPSLAPGFKSIGIVGFLSSSGATTVAAAEGGLSAGAWAGIAAAGAGATGLGVLAGGSSTAPTTSVVVAAPPPTTTVATTTTVAPARKPVKACLTLDPPTGVVKASEILKIDGRCSEGSGLQFRYGLGDGRVKEGQAFITAVWNTPGIYTLTLTVTGDATALVEESDTITRQITIERNFVPVTAAFVGRSGSPDSCIGVFDASASTGDIAGYDWRLDIDNNFRQGVISAQGQIVQYDWKSDCFRAGGTLRAQLTVFGQDGGSDTIVKTVNIFSGIPAREARLPTSFTAQLLEEGSAGRVILPGGASREVSAGAPVLLNLDGRPGENAIDLVLTRSGGEPLLWRLDFSQARHFIPASLRVTAGQVVSRDAYGVVLRFTGAAGERGRIEVRLSE